MMRSGAPSFYDADGLGSITSLTNAAGTVAQTYTFNGFGVSTTSSNSLTNAFQYSGREMDSETGLYYYRARYYDPSVGKFTSEDPIRFAGSGTNFYNYVFNNPANDVDPSGLDCKTFVFWTRCNTQGEPPSLIEAEQAHEQQHVDDNMDLWGAAGILGLASPRIPRVCQWLEARGFAKEIPILEKRIKQLKSKKCRSQQEDGELKQLQDELDTASTLATNRAAQKEYCHSVNGY